jgi:hypothetical protein
VIPNLSNADHPVADHPVANHAISKNIFTAVTSVIKPKVKVRDKSLKTLTADRVVTSS